MTLRKRKSKLLLQAEDLLRKNRVEPKFLGQGTGWKGQYQEDEVFPAERKAVHSDPSAFRLNGLPSS